MSQIRPRIAVRTGRQNEPLRVPIYDILVDPLATTILTSDTSSGVTTLSVKNTTNFATAQFVLIGDQGLQGSEIIQLSTSVSPTSSSIVVATSTVYPHSSSTQLRRILYDQIEFSTATTVAGTKTVFTTTAIVADDLETKYNDASANTGFYFARFKNSSTGLFSSYSDASPVTGYTILSARSVIDNALGMLNKKSSDVLSDEFAFNEINNCQYEVLRELKRWSFMQSFESILGATGTGVWKVAVPTDMDDQNTNKSIYNFKLGRLRPMRWVDKYQWNKLIQGMPHTTLARSIAVGDTTIYLAYANDFDTSGSITVTANTYSYSSKNNTTGTMIISAATTTDATSADVFQFANLGEPRFWTTFGGQIYHWPITGSTYNGYDYFLDYYKSLTSIVNDTDTIVIPDPTLVQYYLAWKFLLKTSNGEETPGSQSFYNNYLLRREKLKQKETLGRTFRLRPRRR